MKAGESEVIDDPALIEPAEQLFDGSVMPDRAILDGSVKQRHGVPDLPHDAFGDFDGPEYGIVVAFEARLG